MITAPSIARGLIRIHLNKSDGLRKNIQVAKTRGQKIAVIKDYINKNPTFAKLVNNAGMTVDGVANLINDRQ